MMKSEVTFWLLQVLIVGLSVLVGDEYVKP